MKRQHSLSLLILMMMFFGVQCDRQENLSIQSPDDRLQVNFNLKDGVPFYSIQRNGDTVISSSKLGIQSQNKSEYFSRYRMTDHTISATDETWQPIWGEKNSIRNHYSQLAVTLESYKDKDFGMRLYFRAFDDGVAYRYEFFGSDDSLFIDAEDSEFNLVDDYDTWWIPQDFDSYELRYRTTSLKAVEAVNTPITMRAKSGDYFLSLHEAALTNYAGMTLVKTNQGLATELVPWPDGIKVKGKFPLTSPWRTIQIADRAGDLIESDMILNLNEPNKLTDTDWIKTGKYMGIWWSMHLNKHTWHAGPKHGATTENAKRYIDFAATHDISGLLVEGWNLGWEGFGVEVTAQDYTTPYPDFDIEEVVAYGKKHGVDLIGHHETAANVSNYIRQMEDAFDYYEKLDVPAIKTGYVGDIIPSGYHHHGQWMVKHYRDVVNIAANHKIMINAHEPIKPTGIRRTYPNMMTREGAKGMEYNAWSDGNPPDHTVILPFTRFLGGPMDYTPGIFDLTFDRYKKGFRVYTTLAKQLAYYVTLYSPWQMAADLAENYEGHPAFDFIDAVYTNWDESKVLAAEIGDLLIIARRKGGEWFLGATTDELSRRKTISLDFLSKDKKYVAHIFTDAMSTNWKDKPEEIEIRKYLVTHEDVLDIVMSPSGGMAVHFRPYKAGNYPRILNFNATAERRVAEYKSVPIFGVKKKINHLACNKAIRATMDPELDYGRLAALVDGNRGEQKVSAQWVGFKNDTEIIIDLEEKQPINTISVGTMQKLDSWIFPPKLIEFFIGNEKGEFKKIGQKTIDLDRNLYSIILEDYGVNCSDCLTSRIKISVKNFGKIPDWHSGGGKKAWLFLDEVIVE